MVGSIHKVGRLRLECSSADALRDQSLSALVVMETFYLSHVILYTATFGRQPKVL